jgi:uncharacterized sporulation protein YeaH/YhbH (DUF444 family)
MGRSIEGEAQQTIGTPTDSLTREQVDDSQGGRSQRMQKGDCLELQEESVQRRINKVKQDNRKQGNCIVSWLPILSRGRMKER